MRYLLPLVLITLVSCASFKKGGKSDATGNTTLQGTAWVISSITDFQLEETDRQATLSFSDTSNRFGGYSGCNMFGGTFETEGNKLSFSQVMGTKRACMPGMKTESAVFKLLEATNSYVITDGKLQLKKDEAVLAELVKEEKK